MPPTVPSRVTCMARELYAVGGILQQKKTSSIGSTEWLRDDSKNSDKIIWSNQSQSKGNCTPRLPTRDYKDCQENLYVICRYLNQQEEQFVWHCGRKKLRRNEPNKHKKNVVLHIACRISVRRTIIVPWKIYCCRDYCHVFHPARRFCSEKFTVTFRN